MAETDLNRFLTHLAVECHVTKSTHNHAVAAILFLYERVLEQPLNRLEGVIREKRPKRLPVVLTRAEVVAVPSRMCGVPRLVATLQYSSGPRVLAALQLRLNGLDVATGEVVMRKASLQPAIDAGATKRVTTHAFLDSFAAQLPEDGYGRTATKSARSTSLWDRADVKTTTIYTHVLNRSGQKRPQSSLGTGQFADATTNSASRHVTRPGRSA
jgi:site-specific recombinase XerD